MKKQNRELFNDGLVEVYKTEKRHIKNEVAKLRYGLRTVGIKRFYEAKIAGVRADKLISVPFNKFITGNNLLIINGTQYEVVQVQEKYDSVPPAMYITLKQPATEYSYERTQENEST